MLTARLIAMRTAVAVLPVLVAFAGGFGWKWQ